MDFIQSPNYSKRSKDVKYIIIHSTASSRFKPTLKWLTNPDSKVSAHYLVGKDGKIVQLVKEKDKAWHAGKSLWKREPDINQCSIGIELINRNDGSDPYPREQLLACARLVRDIRSRHNIRAVLGHYHISPGRKTDPRNFQFDLLKKLEEELDMPKKDKRMSSDKKEVKPGYKTTEFYVTILTHLAAILGTIGEVLSPEVGGTLIIVSGALYKLTRVFAKK